MAVAQYGSNAQPYSQSNSQSNSQSGMRLGGRSFEDLYAAQKILLSNFCRLDFEGARLQARGWERFRPYTTLRANPEFTRVLIVTRFEIETPAQPSEELHVLYRTVGSYQLGEGYTPGLSSEQTEFQVHEQNGDLRVAAAPESPHVSSRAALAWMNGLLADPKTSEPERAHLLDAVSQLNKLVNPPRAN
jgi:hypothetical protein